MRPAPAASFLDRLREIGAERYHDKHPFHLAMHEGELTREQLRGWVANRYYYQKNIPVKDAAILSNLPDREKRRVWIQRILNHDGTLAHGGGGLESWFALGRAVGLSESLLRDESMVQPGTRFAVDSYVWFARSAPWLPAVASSLTELFAPELMTRRVAVLAEKYAWIAPEGLEYFRTRIALAPQDSEHALDWVLENAIDPASQDACLAALRFKCDVLWAILDATQSAYGIGPAHDGG
jgi:pyrroloquinoline-quinone synthase